MRIVLDTNVIVSGLLLAESIPGRLLSFLEAKQYDLVTSAEQVDELVRVLNYGKLSTRIDAAKAATLMSALHASAYQANELPEVSNSVDLADNLIIATAIAGKADVLVTGDQKHLVALGSGAGIPILTPREAIDRILREDDS